MRDYCREYTRFQVDTVYMEPNETFKFSVRSNSLWVSSFVFQGSCTRTQDGESISAWTIGLLVDPPEYRSRTDPQIFTAGPEGISWVCVECMRGIENPEDIENAHVNVNGKYTLPAGWGFAVAQGEVTADGKTATQGLYFAPRSVDVVVSGNADLIILR